MSPTGYNAVPGNDLTTGWGSPSGPVLINELIPGGSLWVDFTTTAATQNGSYNALFSTLSQGLGHSLSGGTIWLKSPTGSTETPKISTPVTIRAYQGPAWVGGASR